MRSPTAWRTSSPAGIGRLGVVEDARQDERVGGVAAREVVGRQIGRPGDALHDAVPQRSDLGHPVEDRLAKAREHVVAGEEVLAVKRHARRHARMRIVELGAEIQALLQSGRPEVSLPPSGNQPRQAQPPRDIA